MFKVMFIVTITYSIFMHVSHNVTDINRIGWKGIISSGKWGGGDAVGLFFFRRRSGVMIGDWHKKRKHHQILEVGTCTSALKYMKSPSVK